MVNLLVSPRQSMLCRALRVSIQAMSATLTGWIGRKQAGAKGTRKEIVVEGGAGRKGGARVCLPNENKSTCGYHSVDMTGKNKQAGKLSSKHAFKLSKLQAKQANLRFQAFKQAIQQTSYIPQTTKHTISCGGSKTPGENKERYSYCCRADGNGLADPVFNPASIKQRRRPLCLERQNNHVGLLGARRTRTVAPRK